MATPSHLRQLNQRRVIYALMRLGQASRADLAKTTGMSQPTVGKIVDDLLREHVLDSADGAVGVVGNVAKGRAVSPKPPFPAGNGPLGERSLPHERSLPESMATHAASDDIASPRLGRPGQLVRLDGRKQRFLAVQLGVVNTRLATLPIAARLVDEWDTEFATPSSPQAWVKALKKAMDRLPLHGLEALLVSVPGVVHEASGEVLLCPNLRWAEKMNLHELLAGLTPAKLLVVQEIRALALGQLAVEPAEGDFLLVDFADGVGGAAVVGGRLFTGSAPLSGELGHTPVLGNTRTCGCGAVGCVETLVSRRGLLATFAAEAGQKTPGWPALVEHVTRRGLEPWLVGALDSAATTIAGAINVLGLHRVVVTGSLTELPECVLKHLADAVRRGAMWGRLGDVQCVGAPRRRTAGLVSAAVDRLLCPDVGE
ncbi:MAG: ROK family protein [Tepidisphaerales bacterium]